MIIILSPGGYVTGGTELLHQLGYKLNNFGFDTSIYYYSDDEKRKVTHPYLKKYAVPVIEKVYDDPENIIVYPEMMVHSIRDIMIQLPESKHVLWWLSVDNAQMTAETEKSISQTDILIHFVQSYYALDYVKNKLSVPADRLFYLSDYINYNYLNVHSFAKRDNTVLFNPRKGFERTARLIQKGDILKIKWRALEGIAPADVPEVLQSAKVYIDFGNHPGKDRFPREAVACGCRLITGRRGSAAYEKDVPIPEQFKINDDTDDDIILNQIYSLIDHYEETEKLYKNYADMIREEFHTFEADVLTVFSKITGRETDGVNTDEESLKNVIVDEVTREDYRKALYHITLYRVKDYTVDDDIMILEGYTRLGLSEEQVTLYLMNRVLEHNATNYEAYLLKARTLAALGEPGVEDAMNRAIEYSADTDDADYIRNVAEMLKG